MNLFFETSRQAIVFLATVPLGFALGLLFTLMSGAGRFRVVLDVLCLLCAGLGLIALLVLTKDDELRLYQLLALLTGVMLYVFGVGRVFDAIRRSVGRIKSKRKVSVQEENRKMSEKG